MLIPSLDISGARRHIDAFTGSLPPEIAKHVARLPETLQRSLAAFLTDAKTPEGAWSTASRLGTRSGGLRAAITKGKKGNRSAVSIRPDRVTLQYGLTPEAQKKYGIHDTGGKINPTEKMRRYFMARYMETGLPSFLAMSLHVGKGLAITIPERPWWTPGIARAMGILQRDLPMTIHSAAGTVWERTG
jgi:hypothetical protein